MALKCHKAGASLKNEARLRASPRPYPATERRRGLRRALRLRQPRLRGHAARIERRGLALRLPRRRWRCGGRRTFRRARLRGGAARRKGCRDAEKLRARDRRENPPRRGRRRPRDARQSSIQGAFWRRHARAARRRGLRPLRPLRAGVPRAGNKCGRPIRHGRGQVRLMYALRLRLPALGPSRGREHNFRRRAQAQGRLLGQKRA